MDVRQIMKNISGGLVNYAVVILTGFFLTPFLLEKFGLAAFGLISLASVLVLCVDAVREALNSMAGRYIMVSIHRGDPRAANAVFNSVLAANLCLIVPVGLFFIAAALFRGQIFRIPAGEERSFFWLLLLWAAILAMIISFYGKYPPSAYLQIPYLLWVTFAGVLNLSVALLNG